jgi:hypothetical protein
MVRVHVAQGMAASVDQCRVLVGGIEGGEKKVDIPTDLQKFMVGQAISPRDATHQPSSSKGRQGSSS